MTKPFINIDELTYQTRQHGKTFEAQIAPIAPLIGAHKLGYNITIIPAGKRAYPYHAHLVNEEMFFILAGEGTLRHSGKTWSIKQGDIICCPVGQEHAHEIINTGTVDLKFLAVSTMQEPEIGIYPDSNKLGVFAGKAPGHTHKDYDLRVIAHLDTSVDYYEGEE
ncbi:cupin domain-containing protein [Thiolinea disciformis]|uniref:cupin domain-containing protein n=1 Tax=Thiolinea disciformis TaxID=125614 RepID=UPI000381A028|nr:cupin domain-containing protein [Thiolinea disciformis]